MEFLCPLSESCSTSWNTFDLTPTLFFAPMDDPDSLRGIIGRKLLALPDEDLEKVAVFLDWIRK